MSNLVTMLVVLSAVSCLVGFLLGGVVFYLRGKKSGETTLHTVDKTSTLVVEEATNSLVETTLDPAMDSELVSLNNEELAKIADQFRALTDDVRSDVQQHKRSVREINSDLASHESMERQTIEKVISRLIAANLELDTRLQAAEDQLQVQSDLLRWQRVEARTDALTALPNRRVFDEEIQNLFDIYQRTKTPASLVMVDIDHFKQFNDLHGHVGGDACLRAVADCIRDLSRGIGGIVTRYGGEEFALLLPNSDEFDAKITALRVNRVVEDMDIAVGSQTHQVTVSVGVASLREDRSSDDWLRRADEALYDAKNRGRNRACYHDGSICRAIRSSRLKEPAVDAQLENSKMEESVQEAVRSGLLASFGEPSPQHDEFIRDVERHLAACRRNRSSLGLLLVSIDPLGDQPVEQQETFSLFKHNLTKILGAAIRDMDHLCPLAENLIGVLLPTATAQLGARIGERTRAAVARLSESHNAQIVPHTVSCGVSEALDGDAAEHLIGRARHSLLKARDSGGDTVLYLRNELDWEEPKRVDTMETSMG